MPGAFSEHERASMEMRWFAEVSEEIPNRSVVIEALKEVINRGDGADVRSVIKYINGDLVRLNGADEATIEEARQSLQINLNAAKHDVAEDKQQQGFAILHQRARTQEELTGTIELAITLATVNAEKQVLEAAYGE